MQRFRSSAEAGSAARIAPMQTERIRQRVRAEHDSLRRRLVTIEALSRRVLADDPEALAPLRKHGLELHAALCRHLDFEERELLPAVESKGEWGASLVREVRQEHDEQRLLLRFIFERLSDESRPSALVGRDLHSLATELREDMALEDRDVLYALALREADAEPRATVSEARFPRTMGYTDALLWRLEGDPLMRSTTAAVTLLARAPERERLRRTLERASIAIPRLRQRVIDLPVALATPLWRDDPSFDLDYHLRWLRAPGDRSLRAVLDLAGSLAMQAFDRDRPLWEFFVVEDLADGRTALIQKLHHAVMDGVAGVGLMGHVYETPASRAPPEAERDAPAGAAAWWAGVVAERAAATARGLRGAARGVAAFARAPRRSVEELGAVAATLNPASRASSPLLRERSPRYRFEAFEVPIEALGAAARAAGARLNDAYLAALAAGWQRYHEQHGVHAASLRAGVPISRRAGGAGAPLGGNRFDLARIELPLDEPDVGARMRAVRARMARERGRSGAWFEATAAAISRVPPLALRPLLGRVSRATDFVASCVRGPSQRLAVAGAPVEALYAFGPTAGTATNVTLFSMGDRAYVTLNVDPAAVPDPGRLAECMREGFEEVAKAG
jgi:WS/DGAT/MGAT family acyltransferase